MNYYLIAGEASGDLHGSNLMRSLKKNDNVSEFRFFGGDMMKEEGGTLVRHYKEMAFMGLFDVIANIRTILLNLALCKRDILSFSPDALILIDYPGFNLRVAKYAHKKGISIYYYIPPKVWAWKKSRIKKLRKYCKKIFVIFPFEVGFYRDHGIEPDYYGNPLKDAIAQYKKSKDNSKGFTVESRNDRRPVVALLGGSRKHEIRRCLPEMVRAARLFPEYRFVVAGISAVDQLVYKKILKDSGVELVFNSTYALLERSYAAVVTSGTATLETALFKVPQIVIYKVGPLTFFIGRLFIKIKFFSLVNIIAGKEVVKEFLQKGLSNKISNELRIIAGNEKYREEMLSEYERIDNMLGEEGVSERIGRRIAEHTGVNI